MNNEKKKILGINWSSDLEHYFKNIRKVKIEALIAIFGIVVNAFLWIGIALAVNYKFPVQSVIVMIVFSVFVMWFLFSRLIFLGFVIAQYKKELHKITENHKVN